MRRDQQAGIRNTRTRRGCPAAASVDPMLDPMTNQSHPIRTTPRSAGAESLRMNPVTRVCSTCPTHSDVLVRSAHMIYVHRVA
jgi:hypothetical protein